MVRTPGHSVPHNTAKESEERKDSESEHWCVYEGCRGGRYRGAEECKDYVAGPHQKGEKVGVNVDLTRFTIRQSKQL